MTHQDEFWVPGKRVSRADLLLGWLRLGEEGFDEFAALSGFEAPKYRIEFNPPPFPPFDPEPDPPPTPPFPPPPEISPVRYYRVVARKQSELLPEPAGAGVSLPDWYDQIQPLDENDTQAAGYVAAR